MFEIFFHELTKQLSGSNLAVLQDISRNIMQIFFEDMYLPQKPQKFSIGSIPTNMSSQLKCTWQNKVSRPRVSSKSYRANINIFKTFKDINK